MDNSVYNGRKKVASMNHNFMTIENITKAFKTVKIKNCKGYDRIPQRVLNEGMDVLLAPLYKLFNLIYNQKKFPNNGQLVKSYPSTKKVLNLK